MIIIIITIIIINAKLIAIDTSNKVSVRLISLSLFFSELYDDSSFCPLVIEGLLMTADVIEECNELIYYCAVGKIVNISE